MEALPNQLTAESTVVGSQTALVTFMVAGSLACLLVQALPGKSFIFVEALINQLTAGSSRVADAPMPPLWWPVDWPAS
jgi:hypothetical protein